MEELHQLAAELSCGDDERAEAAVKKLVDLGQPAVPALIELLTAHRDGGQDEEVDARWWAVRALAEFRGEEAVKALIEALRDPEPSVRQGAALALRKQAARQSVPALVAALDDPDYLTGHLSVDALVAVGEEAVPALMEVMETGSHAARVNAVRALAMIGDQRAIPVLFKALEGGPVMQHWAEEGLERMGVGMMFFKP